MNLNNTAKTVVNNALVKSGLVLIALAFTQPLFALEFECNVGTDKRSIRLELPGIEHLCEVTVTYSNDDRKVMWYADNDSSFCTDKTAELKNKYESDWGFQCEQWPDHDGVDRLNKRQRTILDAELKLLIEQGEIDLKPFVVEGLKAAASPSSTNKNDLDLLVVQFFLHELDSGAARDVMHVIQDNGSSWNTLTKIDTLANYIDPDEGYVVNSALISNVTDNGAMEIITVLDSTDAFKAVGADTEFTGCYGNQTLAPKADGELVARTPHRYFCPEAADAS